MRLRQAAPLLHQARRRISALYVTGDKAKENYAVLTPYMEFSKTLIDEQDALRDNIAKRRLNLNLDEVLKKYEVYRSKETLKADLELRRDEIAKEIKELQKTKQDESILQAKKHEGVELRNSLKSLKEELYPIEDDFVHNFLKLPNGLCQKTPVDESRIIYRQGLPKSIQEPHSHLDRKDLIDYRDPTCYYLKKEAAHFDYYTPFNCVQRFLDSGYVQFVNPDFARTLLLEAASIDLNQIEIVDEEDIKESKVNLLHLTGGGSVASFLGFITKLSIFPTFLPLRFVASGREYIMQDEKPHRGLFTATQSNCIQTFIAARDEDELDKEVETALGLAIDLFRELDTHFRIVYLPAHQLTGAESLRASIQMYSPIYNEYIEVGHLSNYSNYVSKRLLFNFKDGKSYKFPYIAAGSIMNVTRIIACLLENGRALTVPRSSSEKDVDAIKDFKNLFA